ncbi:MAG: adenosylcobinamide-phosphate synthase CbiB [Motiliproteus sp.]
MAVFILIVLALLLDLILGEPRRGHPLIAFGNLAIKLEKVLNPTAKHSSFRHGPFRHSPLRARIQGGLAVALLTLFPAAMIFAIIQYADLPSPILFTLELLGLYFCLGRQSLAEHARAIAIPLSCGDIQGARNSVAMIVSRDSQQMNTDDIAKATVESVLENANDACFATLFWFLLGGLPWALLHRFSNTLDAMWGYRTERYNYFGWAAARLDDVLNWLPARLGALALALIGQTRNALHCWQHQASGYDSPNGGVIMASGAGALGIVLGGHAIYQGKPKQRQQLGQGRNVRAEDIERAIELVNQGVLCWLLVIFAAVWI